MKKQTRQMGQGLVLLALFAITLMTGRTLFKDRAVTYSGEEYIRHEEYRLTPCLTGESDVLEQVFIPQDRFLESVSVCLKARDGKRPEGKWQLTLRLLDDNSRVVRERSFSQDDLTSNAYCRLEIGKFVRKGRSYRLEIRQTAGFGEEPVACSLIPEAPYENRSCAYNGETLEGNMDLVYAYGHVSRRAIAAILAGDAGVLLLLFVRGKASGKPRTRRRAMGQTVANVVIWLLSPVCLYALAETITGHISDISSEWVIRNLLVSYALFAVFSLLFRKFKTGAVVYGMLLTVMALVVHFVFVFRGSPFMLYDVVNIRTAMTVAGSYVYDVPLRLGLSLQGIVAYLVIQERFQRGAWRRARPMAAVRVLALGAVVSALVLANQAAATQFNFWEVESNYRDMGLLYSMYLQCKYLAPKRPEGYSAQAVREIAQRVEARGSDKTERVIPTNVIVVMNESFADLESIHPIEANVELLPFLHRLEENAVKGSLYVPVFGGGTAETEYEALTGNTKQFLPAGSAAYELYCKEPEFGLASYYKQMGYYTIGLHPYFAENWSRDQAYARMGFDEFISMENWQDEMDYLRWCPSDQTAYEKLIRLTERKEPGEKLFLFLVTMQNHGGYDKGSALGFEPSVVLENDGAYPEAEMYLSLMNESDNAFRNLLEYYENADEPTMIVMFGDHLPSIEDEFYEYLFGTKLSELTPRQNNMRYQTPFVIWTNYPQESASDLKMSANYLGSVIMEKSGMDIPVYNRFLLALRERLPVIGRGDVCDTQGQWYDMDDLPPEYEELLTEYRILQYDRVFDRKKNTEDIFTVPGR